MRPRPNQLRRLCALGSCVVAGCAPSANYQNSTFADAGFWHGVWHGFGILGFFVASLVMDVGIYESGNTGFGYNAGFVLGILAFIGLLDAIAGEILGREIGVAGISGLAILAILAVGVVQLAILGFALLMVAQSRR